MIGQHVLFHQHKTGIHFLFQSTWRQRAHMQQWYKVRFPCLMLVISCEIFTSVQTDYHSHNHSCDESNDRSRGKKESASYVPADVWWEKNWAFVSTITQYWTTKFLITWYTHTLCHTYVAPSCTPTMVNEFICVRRAVVQLKLPGVVKLQPSVLSDKGRVISRSA